MYNIVFAGDDKYIKYIAVAISSIVNHTNKTMKIQDFQVDINKEVHGTNFISNENLEDAQEGYFFHVLVDSISEETKAQLKGLEEELNKVFPTKIESYIVPDKEFRGFSTWHKSYLTYYRFKLYEVLPKGIKKALYLDGDMLITKDIRELFAVDLLDESFMAVRERNNYIKNFERLTFSAKKFLDDDTAKKLGFDNNSLKIQGKYFNAGLLLIDIDNWRKNDITNKAMHFLQNFHATFLDQDALNVLVRDFIELPASWNMILGSSLAAFKELPDTHKYPLDSQEMYNLILESKNIGIIHYSIKPWANLGYMLTNKGIDLSYSAFINLWWEEAKEVPYFKEDLLAIKQSDKYLKGTGKDKKLLALSKKPMAFKVFIALNNVNRKFQPSIRKVEKPIKQFRNKMRAKFAK